MYKQKHALITFLFLISTITGLFSQISVSPSSGCLPIGITNALFTYIGSGTPSNVLWNFGDGTPTSTLTQAQHNYPNVGSYTITFTAIVGGVAVTHTALAVVNPAPTGTFNFTIPNNRCTPMTINFSGNSSLGNAVFTWAFGDLAGGTGNPVSHVYTSAGSFTPIVTIQNTLTGCFVNVPGPVIQPSTPPIINITANPGSFTCAPTFTTALDASSSLSGSPLGGGLTFNWNMGSFGTSSSANTGNVVFGPVGAYVVTLTATDNNNCSNTGTTVVSLLSPTVNAIVPPTVCIAQQMPITPLFPYFTATVQSSEPSTTWQMGDGNTVVFPIPLPPPLITPVLTPSAPYSATIHTYLVPGLKTLTITASVGACVATVTRTIFVEEITPLFVPTSPSFTCSPTFTLGFANQTTVNTSNPLSYTWTVNHWSGVLANAYTSQAVSPTFTVQQVTQNPYPNYSNVHYEIKPYLAVESSLGCRAAFTIITDSIRRPTAIFETDKGEGCVPLSVTFTNTSLTNTSIYPITSWVWNFGTTGPGSTVAGTGSTIPPQTFNYTNTGVYYPTLTINTASGCTHTSYQHTINVVDPPSLTYTLPPSVVCATQPVTVNLASGTANVEHWNVQTDLGYFSGCVNDPNPVWKFNHIGVHSYTLSAYKSSCKSTVILPNAVTVKGPVGLARFETNCSGNRKSVKFYCHLEDVTYATLNFGDSPTNYTFTGTPNAVFVGNTTHTYAASGDYIATLTSYNTSGTCPVHTYTLLVTVRELVADFSITNSVVCKASALIVDASLSQDVAKGCQRGYTWYVDTLPPYQYGSANYTIITNNIVGTHTLTLAVKDTNGCRATVTKNFRVSAPNPIFSFNANPICFSNMPLQLTNLTPQAPDSVYNYFWTMGDSALIFSNFHSSITGTVATHSPTFAYATMGGAQTMTVGVVLYATNVIGCTEAKRHILTVNNPVISVTPDKYQGCAPSIRTFSFQAASTHTSYNINFGDSVPFVKTTYTNNTTYLFAHTYTAPGTYTPVFTVTDFGGCTRTQTISTGITIQAYPVASFTFVNKIDGAPQNDEFCAPLSPSVTSTTQSLYPLAYTWDLGNSGSISNLIPTAFTNYPDAAGTYTISLKVSTIPAACSSTTQYVVKVYKPVIDFKIFPDTNKRTFCLREPITVSVTTRSGAPRFQWDFGDGVVTQTISSNFLHQAVYTNTFYPYTSNGVFTIQVTGYAGDSVICQAVSRKVINVIRVLPDFNRNNELLALDSIHCLGKAEVFTNLSSVNNQAPLTYTWAYGDGNGSTNTDINHMYTTPGTYSVKLTAMEPTYNCTASITKPIIIFPLPSASVAIQPFSCPNTPFLINGDGTPGVSGTLTGTLLPGPVPVNFTSANAFSTNATASISTTYSLRVTDNNGCESAAATASIFVQPPATRIDWDTTIVIGQIVPINAYAGFGYTYTWTPLVTDLNCTTCIVPNPVATTTVGYTYTVEVEDQYQCSVVKNTYRVIVDPRISLDVPSAFTPNGDGVNDLIFPDGWGLRRLIYFKVFNRWGQLLYESNELKAGWDGFFKGVPQNMETYVYQVSAETYLDSEPVLTKTGTFKLLR